MSNDSRRVHVPRRSTPVCLRLPAIILLGVIAEAVVISGTVWGRVRQGDRFGVRVGIWPQGDAHGVLGRGKLPDDTTVYVVRVDEEAVIVPFIELFGLFHIKGIWWAEGSAGWSARWNVEAGGFGESKSRLFGIGRIDFFPVFVGIRAIRGINAGPRSRNLYARGGLSIVFANESPSQVLPTLTDNNIYSPGTEGALGFLLGAGGEYYLFRQLGLVADAQYRYTNFNYGREAEFNLSAFWLSLGVTYKTR